MIVSSLNICLIVCTILYFNFQGHIGRYASFLCCEKLMKRSVIIIDTMTMNLESKILLTIKEASDLFGIGQHRLREIVKEDYESKYHLMLGRTIKIKRKQFEEFIEKVEQL